MSLKLNTLAPASGSKQSPKRLGRGIGSGLGKTCGKGHKGQKARAGGYHKVGFEGGQMPLQRRLPKFGFTSRKALVTANIRMSDLNKLEDETANLDTLKKAGIINQNIKFVKVYKAGSLDKKIILQGIKATVGARNAIEDAGGRVGE